MKMTAMAFIDFSHIEDRRVTQHMDIWQEEGRKGRDLGGHLRILATMPSYPEKILCL